MPCARLCGARGWQEYVIQTYRGARRRKKSKEAVGGCGGEGVIEIGESNTLHLVGVPGGDLALLLGLWGARSLEDCMAVSFRFVSLFVCEPTWANQFSMFDEQTELKSPKYSSILPASQ